jgi:uncharacterized protein (TIGR03067 family)
MELKLPSVTNNVLSVWLSITKPTWLFLLILLLVMIAHGSVLYVLGRSEIWRMAREVWSGMILALLIGFFIYSAACLIPPYQSLLSSIMGENVDRQEFQRLEGDWIAVHAELDGATTTFEPSTADILRFERVKLGGDRRARFDHRFSWKTAERIIEGSVRRSSSNKPKQLHFVSWFSAADSPRAIYKLEGDRLTLCLFPPNTWANDWSSEFVTKGTKNKLVVFEKRKQLEMGQN